MMKVLGNYKLLCAMEHGAYVKIKNGKCHVYDGDNVFSVRLDTWMKFSGRHYEKICFNTNDFGFKFFKKYIFS